MQSGQSATASVRVENTGTDTTTFWIGYSVRDSAGRWYDAPPRPVFLEPGEESETQEMSTGSLEAPRFLRGEGLRVGRTTR